MSAKLAPDGASSGLRESLSFLRRRWPLIAVVAALVLSVALAYGFLATPVYESQAEVLVRGADVAPGQSGEAVGLETERQLVLSTAVAERAVAAMRSHRSPTDLLAHASVTIPPNTQVLTIKFSSPRPVEAQRGAQAFADAYLAYRRDRAVKAVTGAGAIIQQQIGALQQQLDKARATLADPKASTDQKQEASASQSALIGEIGALNVQFATLPTAGESPGEVIEPASLPRSPATPDQALNALGGLFLGLILAVGLAILRDRSVEALGGREGLERRLDRPVLGAVPDDPAWKQRAAAYLASADNPDGPVAEAYRALATKLVVLAKRHDIKTVAVTSALSGEGKSATVANLAAALAEADKRVLAISADTRRPRLHQFFALADEVGLLNVLADEVAIEDAMQPVSLRPSWEVGTEPVARLHVVASGHPVTQSLRGLNADAIAKLLKVHRDQFDFVVLDTPPTLLVADALVIAIAVDGVLVVADGKTAKPESIRRLLQQLEHVGARVLGGILNRDEAGGRGRRRGYSVEAG